MVLDWLVLADDRSGALEVAGALADVLGPVPVAVHGGAVPTGPVALVVDLQSRHLAAADAARRAAAWSTPNRHRLHKIDSTLRGRWAEELLAIHGALASRVLVVPALPSRGRTCVHGVVHVDGAPLRLTDARRRPTAARPAALLHGAGAQRVIELAGTDDLTAWLADDRGAQFAVCDAATDDDLAAIATCWITATHVVLASTSAGLAAAVLADGGGSGGQARTARMTRPALVVVGSLHPVATAQVAALHAAALAGVQVLSTPRATEPVTDAQAERAAAELAADARRRLDGVGTLVIVGGDSAAAMLGDDVLVAGGTVAPGIPWARRADGSGPLVVTKAGGFGTPDTLVDLLTGGEAR